MYNIYGTNEKKLRQFLSMKRSCHLLLNAFSGIEIPAEIRQFISYTQQFDESYYKQKKQEKDEDRDNK